MYYLCLLLVTDPRHLKIHTFCRFLLLRYIRQNAHAAQPSAVRGIRVLDDGDGRRGEVYRLQTAAVSESP